ncbi:hypothetical protein BJX76DRAFT_24503 [Aspergillus varians]
MESPDPYPPQSYHTLTSSRSIYVDFTGWSQKIIHVADGSPSGATIYTVDLASQKPQMKFFAAGESTTPLATVVVRANSNLEVTIHGHKLAIETKTRLKKEGKYNSPLLANAPFTWKSRSMKVVDFELRDTNAIPLAQFNPQPSWHRRKAGRLDLFGPSVSNGRVMEEIMVTAFALVHSTNIQLEAAAGESGAFA